MLVEQLDNIKTLNNSIISFGNFDGLHLGHQEIIKTMIKLSKLHNLPTVLLSFNPHTNKILNDKNFKVLTPYSSKIENLKEFKLDYFCEIEFNYNFSLLTADEFLKLIIDKYNPSYIVFGYDNYFGYNRIGSYEYVKNNNEYAHINCIKVNKFQQLDHLIKTSSIKDLINNNNINDANRYLFDNYKLYGYVKNGYKIGRTLGFPTANINASKEQIIPSNGVYSVNLLVGDAIYKAICNIGVCPTLHRSEDISIEVHIMDETINLYKSDVIVEFIDFIRHEKKFDSKEKLINQIKQDIKSIKEERIIKSE